jgi:hypothetical protein
VSRGQRGGSPTVVNLSFLDRYVNRWRPNSRRHISVIEAWEHEMSPSVVRCLYFKDELCTGRASRPVPPDCEQEEIRHIEAEQWLQLLCTKNGPTYYN